MLIKDAYLATEVAGFMPILRVEERFGEMRMTLFYSSDRRIQVYSPNKLKVVSFFGHVA